MGQTPIEWTDFSINPIRARLGSRVGHSCVKISPGCKNCYSSRLQPRFGLPQFQEHLGRGVVTFLDPSKLEEVLRRKIPTKFFWCDMTDMFGDWVPNEMIAACFGVMTVTPWHTHQVLTKRAGRMREWFQWVVEQGGDAPPWDTLWGDAIHYLTEPGRELFRKLLGDIEEDQEWPLKNVWLGTSVESPPYLFRLDQLAATPAAVRFASFEPLIADLGDLSAWLPPLKVTRCQAGKLSRRGEEALAAVARAAAKRLEPKSLDWVIAGGESGRQARTCDVSWIRSIVDQCGAAQVPCFVKQLGARPIDLAQLASFPRAIHVDDLIVGEATPAQLDRLGAMIDSACVRLKHKKGGDPSEWPEHLRVRQFPS